MPPRVALITGCSEPTSLGAALALELHHLGVKVYATARNGSTLAHLAAEGLSTLELDVTDAKSIAAAVEAVTAADGRLDILVNNAGVSGPAPLLDTDLDRLRALFEVNAFAPLALTQAFAPLLVEAGKGSPLDAVVLNVGSGASYGPPFRGAYGSSKAALQILSDVLRRELAPLGIKVVTLELLMVSTALLNGAKPFDLLSPTPSGYYANWPEIEAVNEASILAQAKQAPPSRDVARGLARVLTSQAPPRKL
ncbi:Short-chain dehydrogenase cctT [Vanrija pseudolonga]|uniref:Short-chain dehydrogenase cctT n=1 Tax=Vanrija pseudolonga TaxID=143232 RepID=A0AAF0Y4X7_9TREE|nr:Short-chain dehydrogenase cctT [Vanrija pseudolonga]